MALLRQCLQELRTKQHEWDVSAEWPEPKPPPQRPGSALLSRNERHHGGRAVASRRVPPV
jgi:hypothetical protein